MALSLRITRQPDSIQKHITVKSLDSYTDMSLSNTYMVRLPNPIPNIRNNTMPKAAPRPCLEPNCPVLLTKGNRCEAHAKPARPKRDYSKVSESPYRAKARKFYSSRPWRLLSEAYRTRNPLCATCLTNGRTTAANVADHIVEISEQWSGRLDPKNLQSLCNSCHSVKTYHERCRRESE